MTGGFSHLAIVCPHGARRRYLIGCYNDITMKNAVISKFREKPKTRTAWWAMGLGLATIFGGPVLGVFAAVLRPIIDRAAGENVGVAIGFAVAAVTLILPVAALVTGIRAFRKGERSWVLWVGFVPAMLAGAFWVFMFVGEFLFTH